MPIAVACECGHDFEVRDEFKGRRFKCPSCSQPVEAAGGSPSNHGNNSMSKQAPKSDLLAIHCGCGKRIAAKREWAGKRVKCPGCGESVTVPGRSTSKPKPAATMDDLLDEVGVARTAQRCPECKSAMKDGHVICLKCGYDVERGKKLKTKTYQSSARKLDMTAGAKEKGSNTTMKIVVLVLALVAVAAAAIVVPRFLG